MYIARDKNRYLHLFIEKPKRNNNEYWFSPQYNLSLDYTLFPELRWEDEPIEVMLKPNDEALNEKYWNEVRNNSAIAALQGILSRYTKNSLDEIPGQRVARYAVIYANLLIKELKKPQNNISNETGR